MKKTIIIIVAAIAVSSQLPVVSTASAQNDNIYNESVVVKGSYTPVIEQSEKLYFPAQITDTLSRIEHSFQYSITPTRLRASYEPTRIRAARIVGEPATKLYNNYLRLGMGNYWSPLADLYWCSTRDMLKTYGVRVNHRSSWDKLPDYGPNHFGQTDITLFGKYIIGERLQLHTDLGYEHDHNLYYGFTDSTLQAILNRTRNDISTHDYVASYNLATWNVGVRNMELDARKLGYSANLHFSDLWGKWGQNEMNLNLGGDVHYGFNIANQYKGIAYLRAEWDFYRNGQPDSTHTMPLGCPIAFSGGVSTGNILKVNPYVDFLFRGLQFRTGLLVGQDSYSYGGTSPKARIYPDVTVTKKFFKDNLVLSLAATGGIDAVSHNALRLVNPYINPLSGGQRATSHYDFVFHARHSFSRKLEANAEVSYSLLKNDFTFELHPLSQLGNIYEPVYLDDNRLTVGADIAFVNDELITLRAGGHYYHYDVDISYRPDWDALVSVDLNYRYKWMFHLEGQLLGRVQDGAGNTLPMRYGINAEVEYRHNRALSFFLKMDNLAFQRYWYWVNYPSQRGLFILGLTYTIPHK
mgnify:CR=1 FL=1